MPIGIHHFELPSVGHNHRFDLEVIGDADAIVWIDNPFDHRERVDTRLSARDRTESTFFGLYQDPQGLEVVRAGALVILTPYSDLSKFLEPNGN